mgnify:CR=1 FL=1
MFNNIGKKIKTLVMVVFVLGCIGAVITMILIWMSIPSVSRFNSGAGIFTFFGGLIAGALLFLGSWIGSFFLYGYGELIDSCQKMSYDIQQIKAEVVSNSSTPFIHGNTTNTNTASLQLPALQAISDRRLRICGLAKIVVAKTAEILYSVHHAEKESKAVFIIHIRTAFHQRCSLFCHIKQILL